MPRARADLDYVAVGHVTVDVIGELRRPGGSAFYSALQAARLGLDALIVTRGLESEIATLLEPYQHELSLHVIPAERTTTLATAGQGPKRSQRLLAWAGPIEQLPPVRAAILHLAPVAQETTPQLLARATNLGPSFLGLTPQGLLRRWEEPGELSHQEEPGAQITLTKLAERALPERYDAAVISEQERPSCEALFSGLAKTGAVVAVTAGSRPTTVHTADGLSALAPPTVATPVDDLGTGDVFAAAFFVALSIGDTPTQAAARGNAAAAVRIAGYGAEAIGDAARIDALTKAPAR
jgi:sugar/nucleoside kinase (ribokinase family)